MKKIHWSHIGLLLLSLLSVAAFVILAVGGEPVLKWIPALLLSLIFAISAIIGIILDRKAKTVTSNEE